MSKLCSCSQEDSSVLRIPRSKHKVHTWCTVFNWVSKILSCVHWPGRKHAPFYNQKFNHDGSSTTHLCQLVFLLPFWFLVFFMDLVFFFLETLIQFKNWSEEWLAMFLSVEQLWEAGLNLWRNKHITPPHKHIQLLQCILYNWRVAVCEHLSPTIMTWVQIH